MPAYWRPTGYCLGFGAAPHNRRPHGFIVIEGVVVNQIEVGVEGVDLVDGGVAEGDALVLERL